MVWGHTNISLALEEGGSRGGRGQCGPPRVRSQSLLPPRTLPRKLKTTLLSVRATAYLRCARKEETLILGDANIGLIGERARGPEERVMGKGVQPFGGRVRKLGPVLVSVFLWFSSSVFDERIRYPEPLRRKGHIGFAVVAQGLQTSRSADARDFYRCNILSLVRRLFSTLSLMKFPSIARLPRDAEKRRIVDATGDEGGRPPSGYSNFVNGPLPEITFAGRGVDLFIGALCPMNEGTKQLSAARVGVRQQVANLSRGDLVAGFAH